jgi:hypothetical protein
LGQGKTTAINAKRKTTGKDIVEAATSDQSTDEGTMEDDDDTNSRHDDKRKDHRTTPQRRITQEMIIRSKLPPASLKQHDPYDRPAMIPTPMQAPARVYATPPQGWGQSPADVDVYGAYHHPEATLYPPHLQQSRQMYASQQPYEYEECFDLADHELESVAERRPAADAWHDH